MALNPIPTARLDEEGLSRLRHGATLVPADVAVFRVEGPGAVACLQGLVTNDIEQPGPGALTWNALLTPKGMIVLDLWVLRDAGGFTLVADAAAREEALAIFRKSLPPRLARLTDRSGEWAGCWLVGNGTPAIWTAATGTPLPTPGRIGTIGDENSQVMVASGTEPAWFGALLVGPAQEVARHAGNLHRAGMVSGGENERTAARIMAGWPALGAEIVEKTLPQEVRFDELGGVSYTKGCYLGQETVARVHFRGHPNRVLRGLAWESASPVSGDGIELDGREVGTVRSVLQLPGRRLALATIRREVEPGALVIAAGQPASVVDLPFEPRPAAA